MEDTKKITKNSHHIYSDESTDDCIRERIRLALFSACLQNVLCHAEKQFSSTFLK